jgi:hypothetical protein
MRKFILLAGSVLLCLSFYVFFVVKPQLSKSANFTAASATLSNSRFSYKAGVSSGTSGASVVDIDTSGNADNDTDHLFPKDVICFTNATEDGCTGSTTYTVANVPDTDTFNTTAALGATLLTTDYVVATQSGSLTISFTTATEVPVGGNMLITIPAVKSGSGNAVDGIPDTAATKATNGFDLKAVASGDVSVSDISGCTGAGWGSATVTAGNGTSTDHTISFTRSSAACQTAKAITVTIDSSPGIINPAPLTTHTQGQADAYQINVKTRDSGNNVLDQSDVTVAPVEGVLISATIDETLSLTIAGITTDSGSYCGITRTASSPDTTATSVGWGTLSATYLAATHNTEQQITVSTNADAGYTLYAEENDQMGKDGIACTGASAGEANSCIQDTTCDGTGCTHQTLRDWGSDPTSFPGLGYSLENVSGTDAIFEFDTSGATFNAKQFADVEASESRSAATAHLMTNVGPVEGSSAYVCYRLDITGTQPAGYYYNKVKYTAVPTF